MDGVVPGTITPQIEISVVANREIISAVIDKRFISGGKVSSTPVTGMGDDSCYRRIGSRITGNVNVIIIPTLPVENHSTIILVLLVIEARGLEIGAIHCAVRLRIDRYEGGLNNWRVRHRVFVEGITAKLYLSAICKTISISITFKRIGSRISTANKSSGVGFHPIAQTVAVSVSIGWVRSDSGFRAINDTVIVGILSRRIGSRCELGKIRESIAIKISIFRQLAQVVDVSPEKLPSVNEAVIVAIGRVQTNRIHRRTSIFYVAKSRDTVDAGSADADIKPITAPLLAKYIVKREKPHRGNREGSSLILRAAIVLCDDLSIHRIQDEIVGVISAEMDVVGPRGKGCHVEVSIDPNGKVLTPSIEPRVVPAGNLATSIPITGPGHDIRAGAQWAWIARNVSVIITLCLIV